LATALMYPENTDLLASIDRPAPTNCRQPNRRRVR
jgi:hypothetical protein